MPDNQKGGPLKQGEPHPAAHNAMQWLAAHSRQQLLQWKLHFDIRAAQGSRPDEICADTMRRLLEEGEIQDRYLLGLAWTLQTLHESSADSTLN